MGRLLLFSPFPARLDWALTKNVTQLTPPHSSEIPWTFISFLTPIQFPSPHLKVISPPSLGPLSVIDTYSVVACQTTASSTTRQKFSFLNKPAQVCMDEFVFETPSFFYDKGLREAQRSPGGIGS